MLIPTRTRRFASRGKSAISEPRRSPPEMFGERVPEVMADGRGGKTHEVAGADLVCLIADLGDAAAGEDIDELLLGVMHVIDEGLLAGRDAHDVNPDPLEADGVAERAHVDLGLRVERMRKHAILHGGRGAYLDLGQVGVHRQRQAVDRRDHIRYSITKPAVARGHLE